MAKTNSQKLIARKPRVHIEYNVELNGSETTVNLPFVMGVMSDLTGKQSLDKPLDKEQKFIGTVDKRKFIEIDADNFDGCMKAMKPRVGFQVPNTLTGEGHINVDITFEKMEDFSPANIAHKVDALDKLLQARTRLSNLLIYMDGKVGAEELIEEIILQSIKEIKGLTHEYN